MTSTAVSGATSASTVDPIPTDIIWRNLETADSLKGQGFWEKLTVGPLSLAPWLHHAIEPTPNDTFWHPKFQPMPISTRNIPTFSLPMDWLGGYWLKGRECVPDRENLEWVEQSADRRLGAPGHWIPLGWELRTVVSPAVLCPTIHPVNARHVPVWKRVEMYTSDLGALLERITSVQSFLHYDINHDRLPFPAGLKDGSLPCLFYKSLISCSSCTKAKRNCFHLSTLKPTKHGFPLQCADCVVDGIPCVYELQTSIAKDSGEEQRKRRNVDVTARFMPERSSNSPFTLDTIHFEPAVLPTETVISIGGIQLVGRAKRHADIMVDGGESVKDPDVKRSRRDWTSAEQDILRAKWAVHPDEESSLWERRQHIFNTRLSEPASSFTETPLPTSYASMPGGRILIPLSHTDASSIADLAALGQAVLADLCVLTVIPTEKGSSTPPILDIQFRGTHISLDRIQTLFPRGVAARSALSSKRFDVNKVSRENQELQSQWRSNPESWLSEISSSASCSRTGVTVQSSALDHGWDDVSIEDLGFNLLGSSATSEDMMREVWTRIQSHLGRYLRLPTITATFPILDPGRLAAVDVNLPSGRACPLLLGLTGSENLPTIPAQGGWIKSADPQAIMRSLIYRFSFSRSTKNHPGFSAQLITNGLGATGAVESDGEIRIPGLTASPSMFIGWASRGDDTIAKVAWTAKTVSVNQLALTVYDVLAGSFNGGELSPEQWYIKTFEDVWKHHHNGKAWKIVRVDIRTDVLTTTSPLITLPLTAYLMQIMLNDPFTHRQGLDQYSLPSGFRPDLDTDSIQPSFMVGDDSTWLADLQKGQMEILNLGISQDTLQAILAERKREMAGRLG